MADLTHEIRFKVSEDMHRLSSALCMATGDDITTMGRKLFQEWIDRELHAHKLRLRLLKREGLEVAHSGSAVE